MTDKKDKIPKNPLSGLLGNSSESSKAGNVQNSRTFDNIEQSSNTDDFIVRSYKIRREFDDMLDRMAYWEREYKQDILDRILESALREKSYDPVPKGKKS